MKIELHLEGNVAIRNRRGRQSTRVDVERYVPPVIGGRGEFEPYLADNLRPHVKVVAGGLPLTQRKSGPCLQTGQGRVWRIHVFLHDELLGSTVRRPGGNCSAQC